MIQIKRTRLCNAITLLASLTAFGVLGTGCRDWNDLMTNTPAIPVARARPLHLEMPYPKFGMTGYQPDLGSSQTGDGTMGSAGLPARGGGPADQARGLEPLELAPNQHIGTVAPVKSIRVIVDPTTHSTAVYR